MSSRPTPVLRVAPVAFTDPDTQRLVAEVQAEYVVRYGGPDSSPLEEGVFDPPRGAFFLGYENGVPVAMGGWRLRSDVLPFGGRSAAEVKRMYVAPAARRRGHARVVLAHLEATAREAGYEAVVLSTGAPQVAAVGLYSSAGYELVEPFGPYAAHPGCRCFGKRL